MKYEVPGQDDMTLALGAPGDNTITVPVATTHVWLTNQDAKQPVKYATAAAPAYPTDWASLSPGERIIVKMATGNLYLRKLVWFRATFIGQPRDPATNTPPDVRATVEVAPTNI